MLIAHGCIAVRCSDFKSDVDSLLILSGMATRMMQSLHHVMRSDIARAEEDEEICNRTYWGCFVMDRLVSCGKSQPPTLPLEKMSIHLPVGEQDFAYGSISQPRQMVKCLPDGLLTADSHDTIDNYYSVLVTGLDIWARALEFICNGGRRQPSMTASADCPWVRESPWGSIHQDLKTWRSRQSDRLKYPSSSVAVHVSLGNGESFVFVNLVYYIRYVSLFVRSLRW